MLLWSHPSPQPVFGFCASYFILLGESLGGHWSANGFLAWAKSLCLSPPLWQGNKSHGNPFLQQRPRTRRPGRPGHRHLPSTRFLLGWLGNVGALTISFFLFCLLRNSKLHICVTSWKSSFLRTPDRQSQSWTDTPSCCSDVSFFQSFAAKNISPAFDFPVADNGLWISKYKFLPLQAKLELSRMLFHIQPRTPWQWGCILHSEALGEFVVMWTS